MLQVPAAETKYFIGMLFSLRNGKYLFAFQDYIFGTHQSIFSLILSSYEITKIIWSGELAVANHSESSGRGRISSTINVSRFAWEQLGSRWIDTNDPAELNRILTEMKVDFAERNAQHLTYSDESPHLMPLFQLLHQFNQRDSRANMSARHRLKNIMESILMFFAPEALRPQFSWQEELNVIRGGLSRENVDLFISFCRMSESGLNPLEAQCVLAAKEALIKFKDGAIRNQQDFMDLLASVDNFARRINQADYPIGFIIFP